MPPGEQSVPYIRQGRLPPSQSSTAVTISMPMIDATTPTRRPLERIDRRLSGDVRKENHLRAANTRIRLGSLRVLLVRPKGGGGGWSAKVPKGGGGGRSAKGPKGGGGGRSAKVQPSLRCPRNLYK